jgi:hypothetical protein
MIGINDLSQGREVLEILNSYKVILKTLQEQTAETKVFIQSLLPVNAQNFPNRKPETNEKVIEIKRCSERIRKRVFVSIHRFAFLFFR